MAGAYSVTRNPLVIDNIMAVMLHQFFGKTRLEGVAAALGVELQSLEDGIYQLLSEVNLDTGVGAQLDLIGKVLGVPRLGLSDENYRVRLRVEILVRASRGTIDDLLGIVRAAMALILDASYSLSEPSTATVEITFTGTVGTLFPVELLSFLERARVYGVQLWLVRADEDAFTFATGTEEELDTSEGWGDALDSDVGGYLSGIVV